MTLAPDHPRIFDTQGTAAYRAGFNNRAVDLFRRGAEAALDRNDVRQHVHHLRWTGNALLWASRYEEAYPYLLRAISFDGQPEAAVEDIYAAMTDLCMLSVRGRPYGAFQKLLAETREFLARRGLERWGHRLDLLAAIGHCRRGEYAESYQLASRAWQGAQAVADGPHYQSVAHLNHLFRAAHGLNDAAAMDRVIEELPRVGERDILISRLRDRICRAIRLAFAGVTDANREAIGLLAEEAVGSMIATEWVRDEMLDALRLLAMSGQSTKAVEHLHRANVMEAADSSLLRLDVEICRLARRLDWPPPFYRPDCAGQDPEQPLFTHEPAQRSQIETLVNHAESHARAEGERMECTIYSEAVSLRRRWLGVETDGRRSR